VPPSLPRWLRARAAALGLAGLGLLSAPLQRALLAGSGQGIGLTMPAGLPAAIAVLALRGLRLLRSRPLPG
jgi:hypothetical protein